MSVMLWQDYHLVFVAAQFYARSDRHRLAGITKINGQPGTALVTVFDRSSNVLLAARYSFPDGTWEIAGLPEYPERSLRVEATDNSGKYNAKVADYVSQAYGVGVTPPGE